MQPSMLPPTWQALLGSYVGVALLSVGAAYGLFKLLSERWLTAKFDERLASYKHAQERELEHLKGEINTLLHRSVKLHQREFDVLPEMWGRLNDAFVLARIVGIGFIQLPDVNQLSAAQLEDLLAKSEFDDWQKDEMREARDKTRYYGDAFSRMQVNKAGMAWTEFDTYFRKNSIFVEEKIKAQFVEFNDLIYKTLIERRMSLQNTNNPQKFDAGVFLSQTGPVMLKSLEHDVQARLWTRATTV